MIKNIYIFRHGETDWNNIGRLQGRSDVELNKNGVLQAKKIFNYIQNVKFDRIYTSPLKRAIRTADIVANDLNIKNIIIDNNLIECNFGDGNGILKENIDSLFGYNFMNNWSSNKVEFENLSFPNGETKRDVRQRIFSFIINLIINNKNIDDFLLSSHGFVIKQLIIASCSDNHKGLKNCEVVHFQFDLDEYYNNKNFFNFIERIETN